MAPRGGGLQRLLGWEGRWLKKPLLLVQQHLANLNVCVACGPMSGLGCKESVGFRRFVERWVDLEASGPLVCVARALRHL